MIRLIFTLLLFTSVNCPADIYTKNSLPLGDKEAFMGNTGVAAEKSSGAVYFNPAALSSISKSKISVSGSHYFKFQIETDPFINNDNTNIGFKNDGFATVPFSIISIQKTNDWTYGFSILSPQSITIQNNERWLTSGPALNDIDLTVSSATKELMVGLSASKKINEHLYWGTSLYGRYWNNREISSITVVTTALPNTMFNTTKNIDYTVYSFSAIVGLFYQKNEYNLGLRIESPNLKLKDSGRFSQTTQVLNAGTLTTARVSTDDLEISNKIPLDMTLGGSIKLNPNFNLLADVSYELKTKFNLTSDTAIDDMQINKDYSFRYNLGAEYIHDDRLSYMTGFLFIPASSKSQDSTRVDSYSITVGSQFFTDQFRTGLGVFYFWSSGNGQTDDGVKNKTRIAAYGLILSSSYEF